MDPTPILLIGGIFGVPLLLGLHFTFGGGRRGAKSWKKLAENYGTDQDLKHCHSQDGVQLGSGKMIIEGQAKVGATPEGLVLKPHRMKAVLLPWERLSIEDRQGEWYATLSVSTGEVSSLGIRKHIFDSILLALRETESAEKVAHLQPSSEWGAGAVESTS